MEELNILKDLFVSIRLNKQYQKTLRSILLKIEYAIKLSSPQKRSRTQSPNPKKRRKPHDLHPYFKLQKSMKQLDKGSIPSTSEFSSSELQLLESLCPSNTWEEIGQAMGRSSVDVFRMHSKHISRIFRTDPKWTLQEDTRLQEATELFGTSNWKEVAHYIETKNNTQCYHRWMKTKNPEIKNGKWSDEEDQRLEFGVKLFNYKWTEVAKCVPNRTDIQCRERYCNVLHPNLTKDAWNPSEDNRLIVGVSLLGRKWSKIASFVRIRTDNQCCRRFKYLFKRNEILNFLVLMNYVDLTDLEMPISSSLQEFLRKISYVKANLK